MSANRPASTWGLSPFAWIAVIAMFALRLPHMGGPLDDPHSWRQCDTVGYSFEFARHGIDFLHPKVTWLGAHGSLIFEFALPEALASLLDRAFGFTPMWDRVVALAFFALSAFWFHRIVRELADRGVAELALVVYLVAPLAQYYSRAATVDFAAQAFAHGLLYHGLLAARGRGWPHALVAALAGALAALIKGPYLIPVLPPLGLALLAAASLAAAALAVFAVVASFAAFAVWRGQVNAVNAQAPDWNFLPGYYKEVNPWWWYIGDVHQRLQPSNWLKVVRRLVVEVATPAGALLALAAPWWRGSGDPRRPEPRLFAFAWLAGALAYLLVFFPLNVIHNYYQTPFVAPLAMLVALGVTSLYREGRPAALRIAAPLAFAALVVIAILQPRASGWYRIDEVRVAAGAAVTRLVPAGQLVIAVDHGSEYSDPRLLQRADRWGWAVRPEDLTPERLAKLQALGARWIAWVSEPGLARLAPPPALASREVATEALSGTSGGSQPIAVLHLYQLGAGPGAAAAPR